jgi:hypothetical protein
MRIAAGLLGLTVLLGSMAMAAEATAMQNCPMMQSQGMMGMHGQGMGGPAGTGRDAWLADRDRDGFVSAEEAAAHFEARFTQLDADGDEAVSEAEFVGASPAAPGPRHVQMLAARKQRFQAMDADKDGFVTEAEFLKAGEQRFATLPRDAQGRVGVWAFRGAQRL